MSEELKPCPFCGARAVAQGIWGDRRMSVRCMACDASGPSTDTVPEVCIEPHRFVQAAIAAWNTRAPAPEMAEALEGLLDALVVHEEMPGAKAWSMTTAVPFAMDRARAALAKARGR